MAKLFILIFIIVAACGKHESDSSGYTATGSVSDGLQAGTVEGKLKTSMDTGDIQVFLELIAQGASVDTRLPDTKNATLLIYSAVKNLPKFAHFLILNGADITLANDDGNTAYQMAESIGSRDRILMLIDPNRQKQAQLELWDAVKKKKVATIIAKLKEGADPNFIDEDSGQTPLTQSMLLVKAANVVKTLAEWKDPDFGVTATNVDFPNGEGLTPLAFALLHNNTDAAQILKKLNAKETL